MDENNSFLKNYRKKAEGYEAEAASQDPVQEAPSEKEGSPSLRYEERSGFVRPRRQSGPQQPPRRPASRLLATIIVSAVVVAGILLGLALYLNRGVDVIDFTNWKLNDAQLWAQQSGVLLKIEEQYNDQYDKGRVFQQSPAEGAKAAKGSFVKLTVSKGHDPEFTLPLPDIMSMTRAEIDEWAAANFMEKVHITAEFSETVQKNHVISFRVADNTVLDDVKRNTSIYIIVSNGRDESVDLVTVPNFREKTLPESMLFANENGIVLVVDKQYDEYAPAGTITGQSVKADEKIPKGSEIKINVSLGKKTLIPDFSTYSKQKATAVVTGLGISYLITDRYSSLATGKFISQSIPAGSVYTEGDVLELKYSLGNTVIIASFVGQTKDAIDAWAKELNDQGAKIKIAVKYTQSVAPKGQIIYQNKSNTTIGIDATITITISLGKAVFVPDFVAPAGSGYDVAITRDKAMKMCNDLNIIPVFVASKKSGRLPGEVWSQSIAAGKEVTEGSTITLKYNPTGTTYTVPNFLGMTKAQIIAAGYMKKFSITFVDAAEPVEGFAGEVCEQSVDAGTTVAAGAAITLSISPEPEPTATPEIRAGDPTLPPEDRYRFGLM